MRIASFERVLLPLAIAAAAWCQSSPPPQPGPQPIYRVTVVSRTLPAVNYEHRSGPTSIDFRGTVLLPQAKGMATVESKRGRVVVDAKFEHLEPPTRYGREYLTYVLWAITPEGQPKNLGELLASSSDKAKITVTADLQSFGLMVTAEPYYAVTTPSDVVVLENAIRPDTYGRIEPVTARYELLPRGQYTMNMNASRGLEPVAAQREKLSYDRYEAVLEMYQAQNAIQIARSVGADRVASDSLGKAESLLAEAQDMEARKQDTHMIVSRAREAAQMAEDARVIALKRGGEERLSRAHEQEQEESRARRAAEDQARQAEADAAAAQQAAEREQAAAQAQLQANRAPQPEPPPSRSQVIEARPVPVVPPQLTGTQRQARAQLMDRLNRVMTTHDTPRGLVVTVPDASFESGGTTLRRPASERLAMIASQLYSQPNLTVTVEGFTDDRGNDASQRAVSLRRAHEVQATLVGNGVPANSVRAIGLGPEHPVASNAVASGREQNRRVEIVISGPSIGDMALWDRTYPLGSNR